MRTRAWHNRGLFLAVLSLLAMLFLTGCPKRQDGLVFDDTTVPKKSKSSSSKEKASEKEPTASKEKSSKSEEKSAKSSEKSSKEKASSEKSSKGQDKSAKKGADKDKDKGKATGKTGNMMYGRVVDRNDQPMKRVTILVTPGNTELISNKWGEYEIDALHNEDGSRAPLKKGQDYTINAWKPGYHEATQIFTYEGDVQEIPTITLIEDTIKLEAEPQPIIPPTTDDDNGGGNNGVSVENE